MKLPSKMTEINKVALNFACSVMPSKEFKCSKVIKKCEALCCHCVPMEREIFERNKKNIVQSDYKVFRLGKKLTIDGVEKEHVLLLTEDLRCPFNDVKNGFRCNIYDDRPHVCRIYGNGLMRCTSCPFLNRDGSKRGKKEREVLVKYSVDDFEEVAGKIDDFLGGGV